MSRVGKKPVAIPSGVTAAVEGQTVGQGLKGRIVIRCARPRRSETRGRLDCRHAA